MSACQGSEQKAKEAELEIARSAAKAFCAEFGFSSDELLKLRQPPLSGPVSLERDKRQVVTYRWLGGGRGDSYVQVEIYQDYQQVVVNGGYGHEEFGPWQFDPAYRGRSFQDENGPDDTRWHLVKQGQLAAIAVEKTLYEIKGYDYFFVHVRLRNVATHTIGVDLYNIWTVFYPNQWQTSQETYRTEVDEMRRFPEALTEARRENVLKNFRGGLTTIQPGQVMDYYHEFNANGRKEIEQAEGKYLIIVMDGQFFITDGEHVEDLNCWNSNELDCFREVAIPYPVSWELIPPSAFVMTD